MCVCVCVCRRTLDGRLPGAGAHLVQCLDELPVLLCNPLRRILLRRNLADSERRAGWRGVLSAVAMARGSSRRQARRPARKAWRMQVQAGRLGLARTWPVPSTPPHQAGWAVQNQSPSQPSPRLAPPLRRRLLQGPQRLRCRQPCHPALLLPLPRARCLGWRCELPLPPLMTRQCRLHAAMMQGSGNSAAQRKIGPGWQHGCSRRPWRVAEGVPAQPVGARPGAAARAAPADVAVTAAAGAGLPSASSLCCWCALMSFFSFCRGGDGMQLGMLGLCGASLRRAERTLCRQRANRGPCMAAQCAALPASPAPRSSARLVVEQGIGRHLCLLAKLFQQVAKLHDVATPSAAATSPLKQVSGLRGSRAGRSVSGGRGSPPGKMPSAMLGLTRQRRRAQVAGRRLQAGRPPTPLLLQLAALHPSARKSGRVDGLALPPGTAHCSAFRRAFAKWGGAAAAGAARSLPASGATLLSTLTGRSAVRFCPRKRCVYREQRLLVKDRVTQI